MKILEFILLALSKSQRSNDYVQSQDKISLDNSLNHLKRVFPNFCTIVKSSHTVDFGCGVGNQSIALVKELSCSVVGVDANPKTVSKAIENARNHDISYEKLSFVESISPAMLNNFDVVISQDSFEHFKHPQKVLDDMVSLLKDSGVILLTFGPPWLAPYGSHMQFFCKVPWVSILFPERVVMRVRTHFRSDGAMTYEDVESGLNKMTIAKFESIVSACNLKISYKNYECVRGMNWLAQIPLFREFFINNVTVILSKKVQACD